MWSLAGEARKRRVAEGLSRFNGELAWVLIEESTYRLTDTADRVRGLSSLGPSTSRQAAACQRRHDHHPVRAAAAASSLMSLLVDIPVRRSLGMRLLLLADAHTSRLGSRTTLGRSLPNSSKQAGAGEREQPGPAQRGMPGAGTRARDDPQSRQGRRSRGAEPPVEPGPASHAEASGGRSSCRSQECRNPALGPPAARRRQALPQLATPPPLAATSAPPRQGLSRPDPGSAACGSRGCRSGRAASRAARPALGARRFLPSPC